MFEFKGKLFLYTTFFLNLEFDATKETVDNMLKLKTNNIGS